MKAISVTAPGQVEIIDTLQAVPNRKVIKVLLSYA